MVWIRIITEVPAGDDEDQIKVRFSDEITKVHFFNIFSIMGCFSKNKCNRIVSKIT